MIDEPETIDPPLLLRQLDRSGKGLTLTLRLVSHPSQCLGTWAGPTKEPETDVPPLLLRQLDRPGKGLTLTLRLVSHPSASAPGQAQQRNLSLVPHPFCFGNWVGLTRDSHTP